MQPKPKYLLVDTKVLPEVFAKVVLAKQLLARGKVANLSEAAKAADISRSALYKYKEYVHAYNENLNRNVLTLSASLEDRPGVLSTLLSALHHHNANVLTVNQNIPADGVAPVSISFTTQESQWDEDRFMQAVRPLVGVVEAKLYSAR